MPWTRRMKIAVGAARGLAFLHDADTPVIYRDFKASNILLDEVSDRSTSSVRILRILFVALAMDYWSLVVGGFDARKSTVRIRLAAFHGSSCVAVEKDIVTTPTYLVAALAKSENSFVTEIIHIKLRTNPLFERFDPESSIGNGCQSRLPRVPKLLAGFDRRPAPACMIATWKFLGCPIPIYQSQLMQSAT